MKKNTLLIALLLLQVIVYGREGGSPALQGQPLSFLENKGQIRDQKGNPRTDIDFILQAPGMTLYIGQGQLHYQFIKEQPLDTTAYTKANPPKHYQVGSGFITSRLDVSLEGANKEAVASKEDPQKSKYHYYNSADPNGVTGVQSYGKVVYKNIYPSIDWVLYTNGKSLKYDFIVHPGGKVSDIQMKYDGTQSIQLEKDGSLKVSGPIGSITEEAPYIYEQESKQAVSGKFLLDKNILSYQAAPHKGTLVIDPGVEWATYFGGEGSDLTINNYSYNNMALDPAGYIYISGHTTSQINLATTGAHQDTFGGGGFDGFLAKFDSLGQLLWASYYGGSGFFDNAALFPGAELGASITCDLFGNVYLAGETYSATGIATPGSYQDTGSSEAFERGYQGGNNGYLVRFNSDGIRQWGTYYGASTSSTCFTSLACDPEGNVYVAGYADSSLSTTGALVTPGAHQTVFDAPPAFSLPFPGFPTIPYFNGLLVKFDSSGNRQWATYFGATVLSGSSIITDITCDILGNVYITGTGSGGSVTAGTHEDVLNPHVNGFLSKFDPNGDQIWGSYLNGSTNVLFIDSTQHLYVSGSVSLTGSDSFIVTQGCYQPNTVSGSPTGTSNGYLMQMNPSDGTRNWGTYYGAEARTYISDVTCDYRGNVYITGNTNSYGDQNTYTIATTGAYKDTFTAGASTEYDAFVAQFDSTGQRKWASYYGGTGDDQGTALICDRTGAVYMSGTTYSAAAIVTPGAYQDTLNGPGDVFLIRWLPVDIALTDIVNPEHDTVCAGEVPFSVLVKNQGRLDLEDTLKIHYSFSGPSTGSLDTFFTGGLAAGAADTFDLGILDLAFPADYEVTVYLQVIRGDQELSNDTIHLTLTSTNAEPVADIEVSQVGTVFHFSNANAQPSDSYYWDFGDGETSTDANPSHQYEVTDSYEVMLIVTGFCGSDTATVMVAGIGDPEGISDAALSGKLSIYPNPAGQVLYVKADVGLEPESYTIINALGQQVQNGTLQGKNSVNVSSLASGSYFIRIQTAKGVFSKQFQVLSR